MEECKGAENRQIREKQQPALVDQLADAVAEIRRLRGMLQKAYRLARLIIDEVRPSCSPDNTEDCIRRIAERRLGVEECKGAENRQIREKQQPALVDQLADAVAEIRRLRGMLQDLGVDPDP